MFCRLLHPLTSSIVQPEGDKNYETDSCSQIATYICTEAKSMQEVSFKSIQIQLVASLEDNF